MKTVRFILGDQLSQEISSLDGADKKNDLVFMCEVWDETQYVKHHKKKIAFIFSAMRHFAEELKTAGFTVHYVRLDDPENTGSFTGELERVVRAFDISAVIVTEAGEYRVTEMFKALKKTLSCSLEIREDTRFLCRISDFKAWANSRKSPIMEYFYRKMRQDHKVLMDGDMPEGGKWNYDSENRKPPSATLTIPAPFMLEADAITQSVLDLVETEFKDHFGDLYPFTFAVTRTQALAVLDCFIRERLSQFGTYQDAMIVGEPWMYHSHISFYLNCGLLLPMECIRRAEKAYYSGDAPLNAVEGFIRQILGWREYVRGVYFLKMPGYADANFFESKRPLPEFFWTGKTTLNCLKHCVTETKQNAYAHHIQRLMVLGNFALLAGISPKEVNEWYLIVYADAYEWVELPNVSGMVLFADGGYLASKPYAAGGSYINKMSNYCKECTYKVSQKNGPEACPFNYLYWDFLARHQDKLKNNHRMGMMYKTYARMSHEKKAAIRQDSDVFLNAEVS